MKIIMENDATGMKMEMNGELTLPQVVKAFNLINGQAERKDPMLDMVDKYAKQNSLNKEIAAAKLQQQFEETNVAIGSELQYFEGSDVIKEEEDYKIYVNCPECRQINTVHTTEKKAGTNCPYCNANLFNRYATGIEGEIDKNGYHYKATEVFDAAGAAARRGVF